MTTLCPSRDVMTYPVIATYDGEPLHQAVSGCSTWQELADEMAHAFPTRQIAERVCRCVCMASSTDAAVRRNGLELAGALPLAVRNSLTMYVDYPF